MTLSLEWVLYAIAVFSVPLSLVSWLAFTRLSVARIERLRAARGEANPRWDGAGFRTMRYCWAIFLPLGKLNRSDNPLIDVEGVRQYATKRDKFLAGCLFLSAGAMTGSILLYQIFY
ncbi:hypothetical protein QQM79_16130 [Marinobacteraceae bacterium S3BR75-40.1]